MKLKRLYPDLYLNSIYDIDFEKLKKNGIKGLITDLDNTLVAWNEEEISKKLGYWFEEVKKHNINICVVSNNSSSRVYNFARNFDIPAIPKAKKPRRKAFRKALEILKLSPSQAAVVGDQMFTDVLGGNRVGLFTILIRPIDEKEFIGTRFVRKIERQFLKNLN
ncbi:YqeG family HAD IIIA-type phosphatase [Natranaerofaba carboxydovora]|uniref:YqeG family HAD IIIA-type phosphatase n=1 Tax=Natranaerofaba carboxydovora TaxID=2742683 RepID=UPI001F1327D8|nr:YqeG family HAD IIIA-type phosphatase [Natranaerofaba carboxydovora]UMZ73992.1 Mitochondrial PGP phosphatase [Natranaerofaba carboxydovora]